MAAATRLRVIRAVFAALWVGVFVASFVWVYEQHIPLKHLPRLLHAYLLSKGWLGPVIILGLHLARPFTLLPSSVLTIAAGSLYGSVWGFLLSVFGELLSSVLAFFAARWIGRAFVAAHEHDWVKRYDELLTNEGFVTVFLMRLLFFPFDIVSVGSGLTGMSFRDYFYGTLLGLIPGVLTLTVLGDVFRNPNALVFFVACALLLAVAVFFLGRSKRVRRLFRHGKEADTH